MLQNSAPPRSRPRPRNLHKQLESLSNCCSVIPPPIGASGASLGHGSPTRPDCPGLDAAWFSSSSSSTRCPESTRKKPHLARGLEEALFLWSSDVRAGLGRCGRFLTPWSPPSRNNISDSTLGATGSLRYAKSHSPFFSAI